MRGQDPLDVGRVGQLVAVGSSCGGGRLQSQPRDCCWVRGGGPSLPPGTENIAVPAGNKVFLVGHAKGDQIYTCDGSVWTVAPRADLYGDNGKLVATHFAGPTWQATDGSTVKGSVEERARRARRWRAASWTRSLRPRRFPRPTRDGNGRDGSCQHQLRFENSAGGAFMLGRSDQAWVGSIGGWVREAVPVRAGRAVECGERVLAR